MSSNNCKIIFFSDPHGFLPKIEEEFDLCLIAGDIVDLYKQRFPNASREWFLTVFVDWINSLPFKDDDSKVIWICGNHEVGIYTMTSDDRFQLALDIFNKTNKRAHYLEDSLLTTHGLTIYGTPWCKSFGNWAFMKTQYVLNCIYKNIPDNVDILLTHDAPYGVSDMCYGWLLDGRQLEHIGNKALRDAILEKKPKYNIHGHLHSANHECESLGDTKVYNVSLVDENYVASYSPLILEIYR